MAAYAALVSVMQIIDQLHHHPRPPISIEKSQLQSLTQQLTFLQGFLEGYSHAPLYTQEADPMETRIADAAYAAEDVIESFIVDQILARSTAHGGYISSMEFYRVLQTVIEEMELIKVEAMEIQEEKGVRDQLHAIKSASTDVGSSVRAAPQAPVTVGFDDVLYQMLDKITGQRLDRQIIPIVGMGGIGGDSWFCLPYPTDGVDGEVLENLQTLFKVRNLICGVEMVNRIPNVKRIRLHYNEELEELGSPHLNNLRHLHRLESLSLYLSSDVLSHLVQDLSFPHSLKKLTLFNTSLKWEEMNTKIGPLPLLQVLKLKEHSFTGSEWETLEGQFCSLKFLLIEKCDLKQWTTDNTHFPRLEHLVRRSLYRLREIPSSMGDIPTLGSIKLNYCSKSAADSARKILEEQEEVGNVGLQIEVDDTFRSEHPIVECIHVIHEL